MSKAATKTKAQQGDTLFGKLPEQKTEPAKPAAKSAVSAKNPKASQQVATVTPLRTNPTNTLAVIAEALKDPNFKPENMRLVLDMHKEMVAEQARLDFIVAKRRLSNALPVINKDGLIEFKDKGQGRAKLRFASYENIHDVIKPLLNEWGFDLWFSSEPGAPGMINVIGHLDHENGHARTTIFPMPHDNSGGKSAAQGWASAFSFGKRVATIGLLNIATKAPSDRDIDGNTAKRTKSGAPQVIDGDVVLTDGVATVALCSEEQMTKIDEAIKFCGVSVATFCKHFAIQKVAELPAASYADALEACRAYADRRK